MYRYFKIGIAVFFGFFAGRGLGQEWRWESKFDFLLIYDNNVFESLTGSLTDYAGRVLIGISGKGTLGRTLSTSTQYQGGVETYSRYGEENRMIHDGKVALELPIQRTLSIGATVHGKTKTFFLAQRGYVFSQGSPFIRWVLPYGLHCTFYYSFSFLDYTGGTFFDTKHQQCGISLEHAFLPEISAYLQWSISRYLYERNAFEYAKRDSIYQWEDLGKRQSDYFQEISSCVEIYQGALIRILFSYQKNVSNSYGYSYSCPEMQIMIAKSFFWDMTVRLFWNHRWKKYRDSLYPLLQLRPDSENEESSFTLIDISKDFMKKCSITLRLGRHENESPFRDRYYKKSLVSLGFSQRF